MLAYYAGTMVKTGDPHHEQEQLLPLHPVEPQASDRAQRQAEPTFQWDWRDVAKVNPNYEKFIKKEMLRIGEDSDEFQMSYNCVDPRHSVLTADLRYVPAGDGQGRR
jgi:hypothetical protein